MITLVERVLPARLGTGFRWLLASSWLTNLGDGVAATAGPLLIATFLGLALTHSPWVAGSIFLAFGAHAFIWGTTSVTVRQRAAG
ncbi:hypothetical protein [Nonomuraea sp. NPDC049141]|uniref:hypothetical protein n=1 Tax=unclassified Nonomuraea TaxID=2593643 RepID=UPI0033D335A2